MTQPLEPTLAELRNSIAIRVGLATGGTLPQRIQPQIDEEIRRANNDLWHRSVWLRRLVILDQPLVTNVSDYDVPAEVFLGQSMDVRVVDSRGRQFSLIYDDLVDIDNFTVPNPSNLSTPKYFRIINDVLRIKPYPDATAFPTLRIEGIARPAKLVADADRPNIDGEAIVQLVTIRLNQRLGLNGDQGDNIGSFKAYLIGVRNAVSETRSYVVASRRLDGPAYWDYPTVDAATTPFFSAWNPPGVGW